MALSVFPGAGWGYKDEVVSACNEGNRPFLDLGQPGKAPFLYACPDRRVEAVNLFHLPPGMKPGRDTSRQ